MTTRRDRLCDAAITLIARNGLRGLTHRAVDQAAGVPLGSTSYYFRTRNALLAGVTERLLAVDLADTPTLPPGATIDLDLIAQLGARTVAHWVGPGRDRMLARYELSLQTLRQTELRRPFTTAGASVRARAVELFRDLGTTDPKRHGRDFVAMMDGLIYDQLAGAGGRRSIADIRATLRELLAGMVGQ